MSVWSLAPFISYRVSSSAFVNAEIRRVTAPIAGQLTSELPGKGEFIAHPAKLTLIKSYTSDRRRLLDLERQQAEANEKVALATKQLTELAEMDRDLEQRMSAYRDGITKRLTFEINEAAAEEKGCLTEAHYRHDISSRFKGLVKSGTTSEIKSAEASAQQQAIATKCDMASARVARLKAELDSVQKGVFVRDSTNDVPYSQQQRERLFLRRQELEMELSQQRARAAQLAPEIAEERERVEQLKKYAATLPADYVVWAVPASPGSAVTEGQTVLDLANCHDRFVAVELPEREFEQIKPGDTASVRLIGASQWQEGRVRQVRGSAARGGDPLLAAQVPVPTSGQITVEVSLPDDSADLAQGGYCGIGRLAEVRFQRPRPVLVQRIEKYLSSLWGARPASHALASD